MTAINEGYIAAALAAQGIPLPAGRAERIARVLGPTLDTTAPDLARLSFDLEPAAFVCALRDATSA